MSTNHRLQQFRALIGHPVLITSKIVEPKPDRSEQPGDPTFVLAGVLTAIDPDGTIHYTENRVQKELASDLVANIEDSRP